MIRKLGLYLIAFSFLLLGRTEGFGEIPPLPLPVPESHREPLYECVDMSLQRELQAALKKKRLWRHLIDRKEMAVGLVDLSDPLAPRFARVNGRTMMYSASLPKIAVLLAAYASFEDGSLKETQAVKEGLNAMVRFSSNSAATRMIERIGFKKIESVLRDSRYKFYDFEREGGLWVGKYYAKSGERYPDPLLGLSHAANVLQVCRLYYLLATGRIINPDRSREMLEVLSNPGINHKFVYALKKRSPLARLYRKSGTWKKWHSDSILVWGDVWRRYILVSMVSSNQGERVLRDLVPVVERLLMPKTGP